MLLGFLLALRLSLEIICIGNTVVYFLISFQLVVSLKKPSHSMLHTGSLPWRLSDVCVLMPMWTLYLCGIIIWRSRSEKKSRRISASWPFVPSGVVKAEEQRLELNRISNLLSLIISTHLGLYSSIHKERRFLFCVLRMSNPSIS